MNAESISSALTCIFFIFLILGFLYGLWRGFSKSLTRFFIVIAVAVATFFIVPAISKSLLTFDISSWNLEVEGVAVKNLQQFIVEFLSNIPQINELMHASSTFTAFIQVVPQILLNIVLFLLLFLVIKMLSMIIYWIVCAIFFPKKKTADKNPHRFVGGVVGAVQGLFVALVALLPVFGLINLAGEAQYAIAQSETEIAQNATASSPETITVNGFVVTTADGEESATNGNESNDDILETIHEYSNVLENNFIYKTLDSIGIMKLSNSVFDELTTIEIERNNQKVEYKLTTEAIEISRIYPYIALVTESEFNIESNEYINKIIMLVDASDSSPLISDIVCEVVNEAATIWSDETKDRADRVFLGMPAPDLGDEDLNTLLDTEFKKLAIAEKTEVQESLVGILKVAQIANTTKAITTQLQEGLSNVSTENIADLFENIVSNDMVKDLASDILTAEKLHESFGLEENTAQMIEDVVGSILSADTETVKNEVNATKELFVLSEKITESLQSETPTQVHLETTEVDSLVDSIAESTIITDLIVTQIEDTENENIIKSLNISENIDTETKQALTASVTEKLENEEISEETAKVFEKIFGITITQSEPEVE